jgi:hypothetical protein
MQKESIMKTPFFALLFVLTLMSSCASQMPKTSSSSLGKNQEVANVTQEIVKRYTQGWPENSIKAATQMITKYGDPQEATNSVLIWRNVTPFKRITVFREGITHRFPFLHQDVVEHVVDYKVPTNKVSELINFNGSLSFNRTSGELSSRCNDEVMNIASINLAHDLISNQRQTDSARTEMGRLAVDYMNGNKDPYVEGLQFGRQLNTADPDQPSKLNWARQAEESTEEMKEYRDPINRQEMQSEDEELLEKAQREELAE